MHYVLSHGAMSASGPLTLIPQGVKVGLAGELGEVVSQARVLPILRGDVVRTIKYHETLPEIHLQQYSEDEMSGLRNAIAGALGGTVPDNVHFVTGTTTLTRFLSSFPHRGEVEVVLLCCLAEVGDTDAAVKRYRRDSTDRTHEFDVEWLVRERGFGLNEAKELLDDLSDTERSNLWTHPKARPILAEIEIERRAVDPQDLGSLREFCEFVVEARPAVTGALDTWDSPVVRASLNNVYGRFGPRPGCFEWYEFLASHGGDCEPVWNFLREPIRCDEVAENTERFYAYWGVRERADTFIEGGGPEAWSDFVQAVDALNDGTNQWQAELGRVVRYEDVLRRIIAKVADMPQDAFNAFWSEAHLNYPALHHMLCTEWAAAQQPTGAALRGRIDAYEIEGERRLKRGRPNDIVNAPGLAPNALAPDDHEQHQRWKRQRTEAAQAAQVAPEVHPAEELYRIALRLRDLAPQDNVPVTWEQGQTTYCWPGSDDDPFQSAEAAAACMAFAEDGSLRLLMKDDQGHKQWVTGFYVSHDGLADEHAVLLD